MIEEEPQTSTYPSSLFFTADVTAGKFTAGGLSALTASDFALCAHAQKAKKETRRTKRTKDAVPTAVVLTSTREQSSLAHHRYSRSISSCTTMQQDSMFNNKNMKKDQLQSFSEENMKRNNKGSTNKNTNYYSNSSSNDNSSTTTTTTTSTTTVQNERRRQITIGMDHWNTYEKHFRKYFLCLLVSLMLLSLIPIDMNARSWYVSSVLFNVMCNILMNKMARSLMQQQEQLHLSSSSSTKKRMGEAMTNDNNDDSNSDDITNVECSLLQQPSSSLRQSILFLLQFTCWPRADQKLFYLEFLRSVINGLTFLCAQVLVGADCPLYIWGILTLYTDALRVQFSVQNFALVIVSVLSIVISIPIGMILGHCSVNIIVNTFCLLFITGLSCLGMIYFITQMNMFAAEKKVSATRLQAEQMYRELYIHAPNMFITVNSSSLKVLSVNNAVMKATGFSEEELLQSESVLHLFVDNGVSRHMLEELLCSSDCSSGKAVEAYMINKSETNDTDKTEHDLIVSVSVSAIRYYENNVGPMDGTLLLALHDITSQKKLMQELVSAKEKAVQSDVAKSEFISTMNHELRTPLNGIQGAVELCFACVRSLSETKEAVDPSKLREVIEECIDHLYIIRSSSKLLLGLVNNILDYSRISYNKGKRSLRSNSMDIIDIAASISLEQKSFDIRKMLKETSDCVLFIQATAKEIEYSVQVSKSVPQCVIGDRNRIQQVCINLMSNAVKFTNAGGSIHVIIDRNSSDSDSVVSLTFSIKDSGIGIKQEQFDKLFHQFSQVHERSSNSDINTQTGSGLGLYISHTIVSLMNGSFNVESNYGEGSCFAFTIQLPIDTNTLDGDTADHSISDDTSEYETICTNVSRSKTEQNSHDEQGHETYGHDRSNTHDQASNDPLILVAEDNPINQRIVTQMLANMGMRSQIAGDGLVCVELYEKDPKKYTMILMDLFMPRKSGVDATKDIREIELKMNKNIHIPIIAITASVSQESIDQCLNVGMDDFLSKPISLSSLHDTLAKYMQT